MHFHSFSSSTTALPSFDASNSAVDALAELECDALIDVAGAELEDVFADAPAVAVCEALGFAFASGFAAVDAVDAGLRVEDAELPRDANGCNRAEPALPADDGLLGFEVIGTEKW